jgi:hypothetical protein
MIVKDLKKAATNIELAETLTKSIHATSDTPEYKASTLISAAQAMQARGLQIFAQPYWKKSSTTLGPMKSKSNIQTQNMCSLIVSCQQQSIP